MSTATTALITDNLGSATSKGIEIDAKFEVIDGITLDGGLALNDATYDDDVSNAFYIPSPFFIDYVPTFGNKRRVGVTLGYSFD